MVPPLTLYTLSYILTHTRQIHNHQHNDTQTHKWTCIHPSTHILLSSGITLQSQPLVLRGKTYFIISFLSSLLSLPPSPLLPSSATRSPPQTLVLKSQATSCALTAALPFRLCDAFWMCVFVCQSVTLHKGLKVYEDKSARVGYISVLCDAMPFTARYFQHNLFPNQHTSAKDAEGILSQPHKSHFLDCPQKFSRADKKSSSKAKVSFMFGKRRKTDTYSTIDVMQQSKIAKSLK